MGSSEYIEYLFGDDFPRKIPQLTLLSKEIKGFFEQLGHINSIQEKEILREILELEKKIKKRDDIQAIPCFYQSIIENNTEIKPTPFLKKDTIEKILKHNPPTNINLLINKGKFKNKISSRTKLSLTRFTEDVKWKSKYFQILKNTTLSDYTNRIPQCTALEQNISKLILERSSVSKPWGLSHCKETGEIIIFNQNLQNFTTPHLLSLLVFLHYLYEVHYFSASLDRKNKQTGEQVLKIIENRDLYFDFLVDGNAHDETIYWHQAVRYLSTIIPDQNWNLINSTLCKAVVVHNKYSSAHIIDMLWRINKITNSMLPDDYHLKQDIWLLFEKYLSGMEHDVFKIHILNSLHLNNQDFLNSVLANK